MSLRPSFKPDQVRIVESFLGDSFKQAGKSLAVVGMSGGLDSSVVAYLCVRALGAERVTALFMRDELSDPEDLRDVEGMSDELGISLEIVDISSMVKEFSNSLGIDDPKLQGNIRARCRMIVAYYISNRRDGLVVGTGNKSELLVGYLTKFGDGGVDLLPLGDLYKSQVREMGRFLGVPERIIKKVPSPGLWKGQTDEGELGFSYEELDQVLLGLELGMTAEEIRDRTEISLQRVREVEGMVSRTVHKRKMPLIPKVGVRTLGLDWRE
ncbi:MAG: NAD+ synthase [Thermoplasmata archaeon]